ncbi:MAG: acyl-CoA dehydrogenase, partial [Paraglaciecola sp.]
MNFDYSDKTKALITRLEDFMQEHIYPVEQQYISQVHENSMSSTDRWRTPEMIQVLKQKAKTAGLWNLF